MMKANSIFPSLNLWRGPHTLDSYVASNPSFAPIAAKAIAMWVGDWLADPQSTVSGYATSAGGKIIPLVIYAIPNRDSGGYSSGGFSSQASYLSWIQKVADGIGSALVWYILEPDALGLASNLSASAKSERLDTLSKAVDILSSGANAKIYLDCSAWLSPGTAADLMVQANIAKCAGFSLNVSNFQTTSDMYMTGNNFVAELLNRGVTGKRYVIDTMRNGNGPLTSAFGSAGLPWLNAGKEWCNPPGRGIGLSPRIPNGQPNCAALMYIKIVGESDGNDPGSSFSSNYFGENAPSAGTFWVKWMQDFISHSNMSNLN